MSCDFAKRFLRRAVIARIGEMGCGVLRPGVPTGLTSSPAKAATRSSQHTDVIARESGDPVVEHLRPRAGLPARACNDGSQHGSPNGKVKMPKLVDSL
jgi:hypothetical protein